MHLSDHSLSQLDEAYVQTLDEGALRGLLLRALEDLKEARERLGQNSTNSSRPPSSQAPWERPSAGQDETHNDDAASPPDQEPDQPDEASLPSADPSTSSKPETSKRKPGKQPGAPGFGRTQVFAAHETIIHRPEVCEGCGKPLPADVPSVAHAGLIGAIHDARAGPAGDLPRRHAALLAELHAACVRRLGHRHAKPKALAVELCNDWDAIFRVLDNPQWPITNNRAYAARGISVAMPHPRLCRMALRKFSG